MIYRGELTVATRGRGTYDITRDVARIVGASGAKEGLATIFERVLKHLRDLPN